MEAPTFWYSLGSDQLNSTPYCCTDYSHVVVQVLHSCDECYEI